MKETFRLQHVLNLCNLHFSHTKNGGGPGMITHVYGLIEQSCIASVGLQNCGRHKNTLFTMRELSSGIRINTPFALKELIFVTAIPQIEFTLRKYEEQPFCEFLVQYLMGEPEQAPH